MGISLGLVGLGAFGSAFAELFKSHPAVSRVGLCDLEPDRVKQYAQRESWKDKLSPRDCYESLDDICRSDLDALVIITQHWLHAPQALQALQSGKHVYSAVPVICIPDADEILQWCDKLVEAVRRTGQTYMYGETTFYHAEAMYCRRRAAAGDFGQFTYSEGEYFHGFDEPHCDLRDVWRRRLGSRAGAEAVKMMQRYMDRGILSGPMHYPTHSTGGPMSVMNAHARRVVCWGQKPVTTDPFFREHGDAFSNETALFEMSNGSTMRICEHRECSLGRETFRVYGTRGSFENGCWRSYDQRELRPALAEMRDPLPEDVVKAWQAVNPNSDFYGGHGGSHAYLVHEFVDAIARGRTPAITIFDAARYTAAGAMAHKSALAGGKLLDVPDWGDR